MLIDTFIQCQQLVVVTTFLIQRRQIGNQLRLFTRLGYTCLDKLNGLIIIILDMIKQGQIAV